MLKRIAPLIIALALCAPVAAQVPEAPPRDPISTEAQGPWAEDIRRADDLAYGGKSTEAIRELHRIIPAVPEKLKPILHLKIASIYAQEQRWDLAITNGRQAIALWPENGWIYLPVARIMLTAGRKEAAIALCEEAMRQDPAVRVAANDLIYQIRANALDVSPAPDATSPSVPPRSVDLRTIGVLALLALLAGGAVFLLLRRQGFAPIAPGGAGVRSMETGPVLYRPVGARILGEGDHIEHYRILRVVGSSLHSILYAAVDTKLNRQVALKQVNPGVGAQSEQVSERFRKEVQSLIALSNYHDGVIKVYDFVDPGTLVTEWVEGVTLEEGSETFAIDEVLQIGIELCDILAFAHGRGIVHRDIKPSNVMLTATRRVKLLDFGIAKNTTLGTSNLTLDANVPVGTFTYMAPEQFAAPNQAKPVSDVYSLGLTLYWLITGQMPTEPWLGPRTFGLIPPDTFRPIIMQSPAIQRLADPREGLAEDWVADLDACVRKAFMENPADRYPDAESFKRDLERLWHRVEASVLR